MAGLEAERSRVTATRDVPGLQMHYASRTIPSGEAQGGRGNLHSD